ncbi:anti-sigma factor [Mumia sp. zg.B53]|uniref:anti-sigma factor n=1 Tax=unclassified Mumia TaxID=2621872 RepID=UPI001C6EF8D5|nr:MULTISPECIES: anti-sigma factor [unclassified Mumia]MBW9206495.1 anti-sigma factor [Mumia sp. zg.B17]MBW9211215.1 anti-sigma factor [Mumia sp. zg.B21]MBW9215790.1 anti-sigma factor [Mumia sp. zg.B53]MDD9349643.1 anti-sigma factor [Mumia sp.]
MTTDPHNLAGAYALDALDTEEREAYEAHLSRCSDCAEEVGGFLVTAARLGAAEEVVAPPHLRQGVLDAIARTPQERPVVVELGGRRRRLKGWPTRVLVAAAALALVVGAAVFGVSQRDQADQIEAQQAAITEVLSAPDAAMVSAPVAGGGTVSVVQSADLAKAVMVVADLPKLADGYDYQMWTQSDGTMHSAGVLPRDEQGGRGAHVMEDVSGVTAVAISVEPAGGSKEPTADPIVLIDTA